MDEDKKLTGRSRHRVLVVMDGGKIVGQYLILQVEYKFNSSPVYGWRDATVEDLTTRHGLPDSDAKQGTSA